MFYITIGFLLAALVLAPVIMYLFFTISKKNKENAKGEDEVETEEEKRLITEKELLIKRVDMRIWDALITKFGKGKVARYEPMQGYTEGGDLDIVVTFTDGTSGIYRAYLPLCKIRGAEQKNKSDDYRVKPVDWTNKQMDMDKIFDYIRKNIESGKPLAIQKEMYKDVDVNELIEEIMYEELADKVGETEEGLILILNQKNE